MSGRVRHSVWTRRLRAIRRFFEIDGSGSSVPQAGSGPNRRGQGFHLLSLAIAQPKHKNRKAALRAGAAVAGLVMLAVLVLVARTATLEFTLMVASMLALCGLIGWDIASRRAWESELADTVEHLARNHDRLVREVARNRNDIAALKDGLGRIAVQAAAQSRSLPPPSSIEAEMIGAIVSELGAIGERPRAGIVARESSDILELEMTPPPAGPPPSSPLDAEMAPDFDRMTDAAVSELLHRAVHDDRIALFMQPVVGLPQRKPKMIEVFGRLRVGDGTFLPGERYRGVAEQDSVVPALDHLILLRCLARLEDADGPDGGLPLMLNVAADSLHDTAFMNDLGVFLSRNRLLAARLVFDIAQADLDAADADTVAVLGGLTQLGCRIAMDRVRSRQIDVGRLKGLNVRFIKMDAAWLLREGSDKAGFARVLHLKKQLDTAGIDLIAERIETEDALRDLLDFAVDYGQGWLFAKPDLAPFTAGKRRVV